MLAHPAGQHHAADQRLAESKFGAGGVCHTEGKPPTLSHLNEFGGQQIGRFAAIPRRFAGEFQDGLADFVCGRIGRQRFSKRDCDRIGKELGPFPEKSPAMKAKNTAPDLVQVNRDNRRARALDNFFEAALEWKNVARAGDGPFGKNANDVSGLELLASSLKRIDDVAAMGCPDRNRLHQTKKPVEPFVLIVVAMQHEANETRQTRADQEGIGKRYMI